MKLIIPIIVGISLAFGFFWGEGSIINFLSQFGKLENFLIWSVSLFMIGIVLVVLSQIFRPPGGILILLVIVILGASLGHDVEQYQLLSLSKEGWRIFYELARAAVFLLGIKALGYLMISGVVIYFTPSRGKR